MPVLTTFAVAPISVALPPNVPETIALDYFGDSIINSLADILFCVIGFWLASRLPIWVSIFLVLGLEIFLGYMIRDNLTLNIVMLIWPLKFIKDWKLGAGFVPDH
jgi:hypothetical protein